MLDELHMSNLLTQIAGRLSVADPKVLAKSDAALQKLVRKVVHDSYAITAAEEDEYVEALLKTAKRLMKATAGCGCGGGSH